MLRVCGKRSVVVQNDKRETQKFYAELSGCINTKYNERKKKNKKKLRIDAGQMSKVYQ